MAANRRVAAQHEDWLNLTDAEPPWFALPAIRRALPDGLDPTPPQMRAEHKARWHSDNGADPARLTQDRSSYINWLLRDVLGWADHYLAGDQLPAAFAEGVTRHDVTVKPTGVYQPDPPAPVGLLDQPAPDPASKSGGDPRSLVFVLAAGTDPQQRPPRRHLAGDVGATRRSVMPSPPDPARGGHRRRPLHPRSRTRARRDRLGHLASIRIRVRACAVGFVRINTAFAALHRRGGAEHPRGAARGVRQHPSRGHRPARHPGPSSRRTTRERNIARRPLPRWRSAGRRRPARGLRGGRNRDDASGVPARRRRERPSTDRQPPLPGSLLRAHSARNARTGTLRAPRGSRDPHNRVAPVAGHQPGGAQRSPPRGAVGARLRRQPL